MTSLPADHPTKTMLTRRTALGLGGGLVAVMLTACGSGDAPASATGGPSGGAPATGAAGATRTVTDSMGKSIVVPANPQRILLIATTTLLELGDLPVVALSDDIYYIKTVTGEVKTRYDAITKLGAADELDREKIAAQAPDVIVYGVPAPVVKRNPKVLEDLATVAPTVYVGPTTPSDRLDQFPQLADAINQKAAAEKLIGDTRDYGRQIGEKHKDFLAGKTAMAVVTWDDSGEIAVGHSSDWDALVPQMAGIAFTKTEKYGGTMSAEQAAEMLEKADIIIIGGADSAGKLPPSTTAFTDSGLFKQLPAVKAGRTIVTLEGGDRSWSVARRVLDIVAKRLDEMSQ